MFVVDRIFMIKGNTSCKYN